MGLSIMLISLNKAYLRLFTVVFMFIFFISNCSTNNSSITKPPPTTEKKITNLSFDKKGFSIKKSNESELFAQDKKGKKYKFFKEKKDIASINNIQSSNINKNLNFSVKSDYIYALDFVLSNYSVGTATPYQGFSISYVIAPEEVSIPETVRVQFTQQNPAACYLHTFWVDYSVSSRGSTIELPYFDPYYVPNGMYKVKAFLLDRPTVTSPEYDFEVKNTRSVSISQSGGQNPFNPIVGEFPEFRIDTSSGDYIALRVSGQGYTQTIIGCSDQLNIGASLAWEWPLIFPNGTYEVKAFLIANQNISSSVFVNLFTPPLTSPTPSLTPTPSPSPSDPCYPGTTIPNQTDLNGNPSCCPEGAVCSGGQDVTPSGSVPPIDISISPSSGPTPTPDITPTPSEPTPTPTPTVTPTPSISPSPSSAPSNEKKVRLGINVKMSGINLIDSPLKYGSFSIASILNVKNIDLFYPNGYLSDFKKPSLGFNIVLKNDSDQSVIAAGGTAYVTDGHGHRISQKKYPSYSLKPNEEIELEERIYWASGEKSSLENGIYYYSVVSDTAIPPVINPVIGQKMYSFEVDSRDIVSARNIQTKPIVFNVNTGDLDHLNHEFSRHSKELILYPKNGKVGSVKADNPYIVEFINVLNDINFSPYRIAMGKYKNAKVFYFLKKVTNPNNGSSFYVSLVRAAENSNEYKSGEFISIFTPEGPKEPLFDTITKVIELKSAWVENYSSVR